MTANSQKTANETLKNNQKKSCRVGRRPSHPRRASKPGHLRLLPLIDARFVDAYIANGSNATQAAITAGYSPHRADVRAAVLLRDSRVSDAIKKRRAELADRYELTTDRVLKECACQ